MNLKRAAQSVKCFFTGLPGEFNPNQLRFIGEGLAANSYATLTGGVFLTGWRCIWAHPIRWPAS